MSYATITQLREYLGQVKTGTTNDALLASILERANAIVDAALGFNFSEFGATATDIDIRSEGGEYLYPPAYLAVTLTAIKAVYSRGAASESTEVITNWKADERIKPYVIYRGDGWTNKQWYRLTAKWGYGPAPASIIEVELEVAVNIWRAKDASFGQSELGAAGQGSVGFNRALTWAQRSIIDAVRGEYLGAVYA